MINLKDHNNPIVVAAIHDGHEIREELYEYLAISDNVRLREEDPFTGRWLSISKNTIVTPYSRFEIDLNRVREKAIYRCAEDSWGLKVWKRTPEEDVFARSIQKYNAFYSSVEEQLKQLLKYNKYVVIYDLHSYNYRRNGRYKPPDCDSLNPEINLGTGTMIRDRWAPIVERFIHDVQQYDFLGGSHLDIRENVKFRGGQFPRWLHQKFPNSICCLSIEFRKFFMDEWTGEPYTEKIKAIEELLKYTTIGILDEMKHYSPLKFYDNDYKI